mgnify:CR=1 FL=1
MTKAVEEEENLPHPDELPAEMPPDEPENPIILPTMIDHQLGHSKSMASFKSMQIQLDPLADMQAAIMKAQFSQT